VVHVVQVYVWFRFQARIDFIPNGFFCDTVIADIPHPVVKETDPSNLPRTSWANTPQFCQHRVA
jgi:hypothetical protein